MKILCLNHYAGSPLHGMEFRPYHLAKEWVATGHRVTILAASFSHLRHSQPIANTALTIEMIDGIRYVWLETPQYDGNGSGRIRNMLTFLWRLRNFHNKIFDEEFDVVIASSTYPYDNYIAANLARRWDSIHIYEVHDLWPLSPMELGGYSKWHPFIVATQAAENYAYRHCDAVVSLLPAAKAYMESHGLAPGKFHCLPNGIVLSDWEKGEDLPKAVAKAIEQFREGRFLLGYAGGHGLSNALDSLLLAARQTPECGFILVGKGPEKERLRVQVTDLDNVLFIEPIPKSCIPAFLQRMDALYLGWNRSPLYQYGISPNKLFDYMMSAKPVVHAVDAGNDPCVDARCGISVPPEDSEEIAAAVRRLAAMSPAEREDMGKRGHDYVVANHDYRVLAARFVDVMQEAIDKKRSASKRFPKGKE